MSYSTTISASDIKVNQFSSPSQHQPPSTSLTDLLSSSRPTQTQVAQGERSVVIDQQQPFTPNSNNQLNSGSNYVDIDIINDFSNHQFNGGGMNLELDFSQKQSQQDVSNGPGNGSGTSMSTLVTTLGTVETNLSGKMSTLCNGTMPNATETGSIIINPSTNPSPFATSTQHLQKKLEKKIAQASAIAGLNAFEIFILMYCCVLL